MSAGMVGLREESWEGLSGANFGGCASRLRLCSNDTGEEGDGARVYCAEWH